MITALVIDDNRETADSISQMLTLLEVEVSVAYGSRAGLLSLRELTPDILFLDINMPGLGGFEILGFMHREPRLEDIPIVIVTTDDQQETLEQANTLGALDLLIKPVTFEQLEEALRKARLVN